MEAAAIIGAVAAVGGAAVSYKQSKAQGKVLAWEAEQQAKAATLQYKQQQASRLNSLRTALANNTVTAAVSGVSVTDGNVGELQNRSVLANERDELNSRAQYLGGQSALDYQKSAAASVASMGATSSILQGIGGIANGYAGYQSA